MRLKWGALGARCRTVGACTPSTSIKVPRARPDRVVAINSRGRVPAKKPSEGAMSRNIPRVAHSEVGTGRPRAASDDANISSSNSSRGSHPACRSRNACQCFSDGARHLLATRPANMSPERATEFGPFELCRASIRPAKRAAERIEVRKWETALGRRAAGRFCRRPSSPRQRSSSRTH